ncbi:MAG TPA: PhoU domain-containing protein, partial [Acidimicrobiales bacterium]|nr:PhoU domain-containing protein [Acidimicrobiales bacterium]
MGELLRHGYDSTLGGDTVTGRAPFGAGAPPAVSTADDGPPLAVTAADIALIDKRVIQLFALVGEAIAGSTAVLLTGDRVAARALVQRDADIDARYRELDRAVLALLAEGRP